MEKEELEQLDQKLMKEINKVFNDNNTDILERLRILNTLCLATLHSARDIVENKCQ